MSKYDDSNDEHNDDDEPIDPPPFAKGLEGAIAWADWLIKQHGPIKCYCDEWWRWSKQGFWVSIKPDWFKPYAVKLQQDSGPGPSTRMTSEIIGLINAKCQHKDDLGKPPPWRYVTGFKNPDTVMINVVGGALRVHLRTGEVELIKPDHRHWAVGRLPVVYDPEATCLTFEQILTSCLPDPLDQLVFWLYCGYLLLPDFRFKRMLFCYGNSDAGKTLLVREGLGAVFGEGLMSYVSFGCICEGREEVSHLEKALVNVSGELSTKILQDSELFKQLVGGESTCRAFKYKGSREVLTKAKMVALGNHPPKWPKGDEAVGRRILLLHFGQDFGHLPRDGKLEKAVKLEGSGILNWLIQGLIKVAALTHLPEGSEASREFYAKFREGNSPVEEFLKQHYVIDNRITRQAGRVRPGNLYWDFCKWCEDRGIEHHLKDPNAFLGHVREQAPFVKSGNIKVNGKDVKTLWGIRRKQGGDD